MIKQSWITRLFIKHVLGVQRTPFYLRNGYAESPRLKPLGDTVVRVWKVLGGAPIAAYLLSILLTMTLNRHDPEVLGKAMCIVFGSVICGVVPLQIANTIRRQIMIDGN